MNTINRSANASVSLPAKAIPVPPPTFIINSVQCTIYPQTFKSTGLVSAAGDYSYDRFPAIVTLNLKSIKEIKY